MVVYLIEDNVYKADEIRQFLSESSYDICLEIYKSFQSGLRAIEAHLPDLLLLDMTLPTFDQDGRAREGRIRPLGGYDLMRKLKIRKLEIDTIVVTQLETFGEGRDQMTYHEMIDKCSDEFGKSFLGGVQFLQGSNSWKSEMKHIMDQVFSKE